MTPSLRSFVIAVLCGLLSIAAHASEPVGQRPEIPVFDTLGFLPNGLTEEITEPLLEARKNDDLDVIVVVIPDFGDASPQEIAKHYSDAWCDPDLNAIVLYSPGREQGAGPWIVPGGTAVDLLKSTTITAALSKAKQKIDAEPVGPEKIRVAAIAAIDLLKGWKNARWKNAPAQVTPPSEPFWHQTLQSLHLNVLELKLFGLVALGLFIPLLIGSIALIISIRKRRPKYFPSAKTHRRLGAPYAGGNSNATQLSTYQR